MKLIHWFLSKNKPGNQMQVDHTFLILNQAQFKSNFRIFQTCDKNVWQAKETNCNSWSKNIYTCTMNVFHVFY